ncbi:MAG: hypothetical protein ACTHOO_05070 [Alcanivorax sp.]
MIQTLDTFNNDSLDPKGVYIIAMNYYSKPGITLGQDGTGELSPTADTFESGISEDAFYKVMEDFAAQHDQEVIYEDDEVVIMTANEKLYHAIHEECGDRFTYDIGGQKMVQSYISYELSEIAEMEANGYLEDEEETYDAPHLDS